MADSHVSTVSDNAPYYDINTPNISPANSQIIFNDTDLNVLNQCSDFAITLQNIVGDLRQNGYTDRQIPSFPKAELLRIMGINKRKKVLRGQQLHEFLKSKLVHVVLDGEITPPSATGNFTLDVLGPLLQNGSHLLNSMKVRTLHSCLNYGLWLNITYQCFEFNKGAGLVTGSWSNWLLKNVGISSSYSRQLRDLSEKFVHYKNMHYLSISIKDLYKMRYEIIHMFSSDQGIANFWLGN